MSQRQQQFGQLHVACCMSRACNAVRLLRHQIRRLPQRLRDSAARGASLCGMLVYAACAQPTGADPIILMVETYSERADAIQNMAIRGPGGTLHQTHLSTVGVRGEDLIPGSNLRARWRPTRPISQAQALCRSSGGGWDVDCRRRTAHPSPLFLAIRSQSRVTVGPSVETDPEGVAL